MIDVKQILYEICEDEAVFDKDIDLIDSGLLDSYTFIELFSRLEDYNIILYPTQIDRNKLRTIAGIEELINDYLQEKK
ncbi:MAG: D-alanine--poly(phosphoribitol) ligase subunit 2 [Bacilli bacterium]|nr:D-alanine--poly(phosphoribitol) ligase subunit 2 [Bacilli bacterium]